MKFSVILSLSSITTVLAEVFVDQQTHQLAAASVSEPPRLLSISEGKTLWGNPEDLVEQNVKFMDVTDSLDVPDRADYTRVNHRDLRK